MPVARVTARIRLRRLLAVIATVITAASASAATGQVSGYDDYDPAGVYLGLAESTPLTTAWRTSVDTDGIIVFRYRGKAVKHPTHIAMYGLQQYSIWLRTGDPAARASAIRQARWLVRNQDRATGAWRYPFPFRVGGTSILLPAGWISAMAQGQAISLLTRVHRLLPDQPAFLAAARRGLAPLRRHVRDGGTLAVFQGRPFFEEYPTTPGTFTLNGFQFTMLGLADLASLGDDSARRLYLTGEKSLTAMLPLYDAGTTTAYHLGFLTLRAPLHQARGYHPTHVMLLRALDHIRPNPTFIEWSNRWAGYPAMQITTRVSLPTTM